MRHARRRLQRRLRQVHLQAAAAVFVYLCVKRPGRYVAGAQAIIRRRTRRYVVASGAAPARVSSDGCGRQGGALIGAPSDRQPRGHHPGRPAGAQHNSLKSIVRRVIYLFTSGRVFNWIHTHTRSLTFARRRRGGATAAKQRSPFRSVRPFTFARIQLVNRSTRSPAGDRCPIRSAAPPLTCHCVVGGHKRVRCLFIARRLTKAAHN